MKSLERALFLCILATALVAQACEPTSVPPWPYTTTTGSTATPDGGDSADVSNDAGGIAANYPPSPLRCDSGLCNTDNYSLCNIADRPEANGATVPFSVLAVVAAVAIARKRRDRRKARRSS